MKFGVPRISKRCNPISHQGPFLPPEDWYEPADVHSDYDIVDQQPGRGYRHVVTAREVRDRLAELPARFTRALQVVQLSGMTRKKLRYPLYGMQWGPAIYLYPIAESLTENFARPPTPAQRIEANMYGGLWRQLDRGQWQLCWTDTAIKDFYLNNVLIHELGHLLDTRNRSERDRERYAEWFAIEFGYRPSRACQPVRREDRTAKKRHHAS